MKGIEHRVRNQKTAGSWQPFQLGTWAQRDDTEMRRDGETADRDRRSEVRGLSMLIRELEN
jgi:hypothetical protein